MSNICASKIEAECRHCSACPMSTLFLSSFPRVYPIACYPPLTLQLHLHPLPSGDWSDGGEYAKGANAEIAPISVLPTGSHASIRTRSPGQRLMRHFRPLRQIQMRRKTTLQVKLIRPCVWLQYCRIVELKLEIMRVSIFRCMELSEFCLMRPSQWGVLIYKRVSDLIVTIVQPRDMNFKGRTTFTGSNFFIVHFPRVKNFPFNFLVF